MCFETARNGPSRSSKVVDFGTNFGPCNVYRHVTAPYKSSFYYYFIINRKRVCDLLLLSNLGPILPRFRDIAGFLRRATPPLFYPNFRGVRLGLDCRCCGSEERRPYANVISCELIKPICPQYSNVTEDRGTDRWTDGRTTYRASTTYIAR